MSGLTGRIALVISILMSLFSMGYIGYATLVDDGEKEVTKCYDRFSNEIIGEECYQDSLREEFNISMLLMAGAVIFFAIFILEDIANY